MMHSKALLSLLAIPALVSAHFELVWPTARGTDDENQYTGPCGGYDQTQNRTRISASGFELQLNLGHDHSVITVLLALGNEAGGAFNTFLYPTVQEEGPGYFCYPTVTVPSDLNIEEGTNGTIQVITDGHGGGLYSCADVTFVAAPPPPKNVCTNGTGLTGTFLSNPQALANGTSESSDHGSDSSNSTSSDTNGAARSSVGWGVLGAAVMAAAAAL